MKFIYIICVAILLPNTAYATQERDGNWLLNKCNQYVAFFESDTNKSTETLVGSAICNSYIDGLLDGHLFTSVMHDKSKLFCFPEGFSQGQKIRVIVKYLESHPEELHLPAYHLGLYPLKSAFPCENE